MNKDSIYNHITDEYGRVDLIEFLKMMDRRLIEANQKLDFLTNQLNVIDRAQNTEYGSFIMWILVAIFLVILYGILRK